MSQPEDDRDLINFLHRYRPNPPPSNPDLEDQILKALPRRSRRQRWMVPSALAASLVGAIAVHQALQPRPQAVVNTTEIEDYMESNWSTTMHGTSDLSNATSSSDDLAFVDFTE